jgi:hypothetical protein
VRQGSISDETAPSRLAADAEQFLTQHDTTSPENGSVMLYTSSFLRCWPIYAVTRALHQAPFEQKQEESSDHLTKSQVVRMAVTS